MDHGQEKEQILSNSPNETIQNDTIQNDTISSPISNDLYNPVNLHTHDLAIKKSKYVFEAPAIVKKWREAKIDWHDLLPKHLSAWERFGVPSQENKLRLLMAKEEQLTDFLTQFYESGLAAEFGHDYGPLANYTAW